MPLRVQLRDLPSEREQREPYWEFAWRIGQHKFRATVREGESWIGSSPRANILIDAPGVRSRHLRIKRNGDRIFIEPLGGSAVVREGQLVQGFVQIQAGAPFSFGPVTAAILRVDPEDYLNAVPMRSTSDGGPVAGQATPEHSSEIQHLALINDCLARQLEPGNSTGPEDLLAGLRQLLAPISAAFLMRTSDWSVLAEFSQGPSVAGAEPPPGAFDYDLQADGRQLFLRVLFCERSNAAWQDEICRSFLLMLALNGSNKARPISTEAPSNGVEDVWSEFVGLQIRSHLAGYTEQCRYADNVLIVGETGTGKELAARSLHRLWMRKGEFVALNCAALPADLLDAELFGIEAGAATGVTARGGRLEQAKQGTLFLDEISEMPIHLQGKLLRVLQEKTYFKVGSSHLRRTDVKIIAASNRQEHELRSGGCLRLDLYFRLAQAVLELLPLRSHTEDIAALCGHFLSQLEQKQRRGVTGLSRFALDQMKGYSWPGNVRELQNLLHSLYARTGRGALIQAVDLPAEWRHGSSMDSARKLGEVMKDLRRETIKREIARAPSISAAAKTLGVSESYLHRMIKKHGLREDIEESSGGRRK